MKPAAVGSESRRGDFDGAADEMAVYAPSVGIGQIDGAFTDFSGAAAVFADMGFKPLDSSDATKINYIPFSGGGESLAAILGSKVTAGISGYGEYEGQIKAGRLRLIGVTSAERLPNINGPTFKEHGIDLVIANWRSVMAPPGLTPEQKRDLVDLIGKMAKSEAWKEILKQKGWDDAFLGGDAFADFLKQEQTRVAGVLKSVGLVKP